MKGTPSLHSHAPTNEMLAVVAESFGPPDVLQIRRWPRPVPGPGHVLIAVDAVGVNPVDAGNRADGTWAGLEAPFIPGSDASGVVVELGQGVQDRGIGERVFLMTDFLGRREGTYAQFVSVAAAHAVPVPSNIGTEDAAAVPLAAGTAWEAIERLDPRREETIVIVGAAGGVGTFAVQLAQRRGAAVIAIASERHWPTLFDLGARACIGYADGRIVKELGARFPAGIDALLDLVGGDTITRTIPLMRPGGRVATTVTFAGDLDPAVDRNLTLHGILVRPDGERLHAIARLLEQGELRPVVNGILPWRQAADAHRRLETGHGCGKIVLAVERGRRGTS